MKTKGKITSDDFNELFRGKFGYENEKVIQKPGFGVDISWVDLGSQILISASDPLSYIPILGAEKSAWLSVQLTVNDIITSGIPPQYFQMVLNLNENMSHKDFTLYWDEIHRLCEKMNISITGGHTGTIAGQNTTISGGGTMMAIADKKHAICSSKAKEGDLLLMTKQAGISSCAILGLCFPNKMNAIFGKEMSAYFEDLFYKTSVYKEGKIIGELNKIKKTVNAMHDVTEGGILGAAFEMAVASKKGILLLDNKILTDDIQNELCDYLELNPHEIIGAGSMLMSVNKNEVDTVLSLMQEAEIPTSIIGEFKNENEGYFIQKNDTKKQITVKNKDPYWEKFAWALQNNWS